MADEVWTIDVRLNVVGATQVQNTTRAVAQMTAAEQQNTRATQAMNAEHQKASSNFGAMTRQALLMGAGMAGANSAIYAVGNAFRSTLGQAIAFDAGLRNVQSITHITEDELQALEGDLTNLVLTGDSAGQSLSQLTDTQYLLASSGFDAQESLQLLNVAAMGAAAGQTDAATSGRVLAAILNAYDLPVSSAREAMDSLFQTVNLGVIDFEQLSQFMGQVIPTAAQLGISLDDLGAAIAVMTRKGIEPANALTALNQALVQYIDPSAEARKLTAELGIELSADEIRTKGFLGALQDLIPAVQGNDEAISILFGNVRAMRAIMALTTDGGVAYNEMMAGMATGHEGAGATAEAFARQSQSVQYQLEELKVVGMAILAEAILPLLRDGVVPLAEGMGALYSVAAPLVDIVTENEIAMRAFSSVLIGLAASKVLVLMGGWLVSLSRALIGYTAAAEAGTVASWGLAAATRAILPVAIAFGAITLWNELKEDPASELAAMAAETNNLAEATRNVNAAQQGGLTEEQALERVTDAQEAYNAAQAEYDRLLSSRPDPGDGPVTPSMIMAQDEWAEAWAAAQDNVTDTAIALDAAEIALRDYDTVVQKAVTNQQELVDTLKETRDEALKLATAETPEQGLLKLQAGIVEEQIRKQEALGVGANVETLMRLYAQQEDLQGQLEGIEGSQNVAKLVADLYKIPGITPEQIRGAVSSASSVLTPQQTGKLTGAVALQPQIAKIEINLSIPEGRGAQMGEQILREVEANREKIAATVLGSLNDAVEQTAQALYSAAGW